MPFFGVSGNLGLDNRTREIHRDIDYKMAYHKKQIQYHKDELRKLEVAKKMAESDDPDKNR